MKRSHTLIALTFAVLSVISTVAYGYDLGCQYVWKEPSKDNDIVECIKKIPTENGGVLIPPIIPLVFGALVFVLFPIVFFCRCFGGFGSDSIRPGSDCCCDGEEWDDIPVEEKVTVYPRRHVCCVKIVCVLVVIICAAPIALMPIGGKYGVRFWNGFYDSASVDVLDWVQNLKTSFLTELLGNGTTLPSPITMDTFDNLQSFIDTGRTTLDDINNYVQNNVDFVNNFLLYSSFIPFILLAFMLVFSLFNIRRFFPAIFMWIYYFFSVLLAAICVLAMLLGVVCVLLGGEVDLQGWKAPGVLQWYGVPYCESEAKFHSIKAEFQKADTEQSHSICNEFLTVCDDLPFSLVDIPGVASTKPFYCKLTAAAINSTCTSIIATTAYVNATQIKAGAAAFCPNCTVGDCPTKCPNGQMKDKAKEIANAFEVGTRIINVIDHAFLYADCDVLITQAIKPLKDTTTAAVGLFLAAAGTGIAAVCLMFGIILLMKGQKLFHPTPDAEDLELQRQEEIEQAQAKKASQKAKQKRLKGGAETEMSDLNWKKEIP